ncbi:MAG: hypothetical protein ACRDTQ_00470 [Micromonosporaceae bacterium]
MDPSHAERRAVDGAGGGDDSVRLTTASAQKTTGTFNHTFPPGSVTVLTLTPL